jgi:hypothetical protein
MLSTRNSRPLNVCDTCFRDLVTGVDSGLAESLKRV